MLHLYSSLRFSDVFRWYRNLRLGTNGLNLMSALLKAFVERVQYLHNIFSAIFNLHPAHEYISILYSPPRFLFMKITKQRLHPTIQFCFSGTSANDNRKFKNKAKNTISGSGNFCTVSTPSEGITNRK